ncbi:hypothetical protein UFOVP180_25 [uncultured Caudovirales phage]|uniref:Uncharacterized protein n=1 Tax=uncultured Caudovirales phage TaxID=2100421 RepID=A0A6J7WDH1_9CAUD|nr:hypothetical protein UFOVP180_25 [uncultured Caudovirales phage]
MTKSTLATHEAVCAERYASIDQRLTTLEHKVDGIHTMIDDFKNFIIKLAFKTGFGLIIAISGAVFVIKM